MIIQTPPDYTGETAPEVKGKEAGIDDTRRREAVTDNIFVIVPDIYSRSEHVFGAIVVYLSQLPAVRKQNTVCEQIVFMVDST